MKSISTSRARVLRLVIVSLLSFAGVVAVMTFAVSAARKASNTSSSPTNLSLSNTATDNDTVQQQNAPLAANITATLMDNVTQNTNVAGTVHAAGRGNPWINFQDGRNLLSVYTEAATESLRPTALINYRQAGVARPLSLASNDFDLDGYPDLVCAYATSGGGILALHRSDKEAFDHTNPVIVEGLNRSQFPDPFVKDVAVFKLPEAPYFLGTGDFDRDGHQDLITAARASDSMYVLCGDGHGGFSAPKRVTLPGTVTAMVTGDIDQRDGMTDVVVGITAPDGPELLIYEGGAGSILEEVPRMHSLPAEATSLTIGNLDDDSLSDVAIIANGEVMILHGRDQYSSAGQPDDSVEGNLEQVPLPFAVTALTLGDFIWDRDHRTEIASLTEDGTVNLVTRGAIDTRPFTLNELGAQRLARLKGEPSPEQSNTRNSRKPEKWNVAESHFVGTSASSRVSPQALLVRGRVSAQMTEDLLVLDPTGRQARILFTEPAPRTSEEMAPAAGQRLTVEFDVASEPVAMLPMRLNVMGEDSLVVLREGQVEPTLMMVSPLATFNVTTTTDCNTSGCGSLRRAITDANASAGSDMITFTNLAGSPDLYTLTLTGAEESANASGDLDITGTVTITGNGSSETIIQAGTTNANGIDKVFSVNQLGTTSASATFDGVTVRFARNNNTCDIITTFRHLGGGIDFFGGLAATTTSLTVQNSTISDNTIINTCAPNVGAGISPDDGNFTISNSTVQNNVTTNSPGGGFSHTGNARTLSMTNVTVQNNQAKGGPNGEAGGIWIRQNQNGSASISGSTITNNTAESRAGGIKLESQGAAGLGALTSSITNTTISSNTSQGINGGISEGGGVYYSTNTSFGGGTHTLNFASSGSIASNTATTGSGLFINLGSVSVSSANMTLNNSLFIATGSMGQTTAFTAPSGTLSIGGDFTNNNTFTHNSGTMNFNGTSAQIISGSTTTTFNHLTDSNTSAAVSVNNNINVNGNLTVNASAILTPSATTIIGGSGTLTGSGRVDVTRTAATADFLTQYSITNKTLTNLTVNYSGAGSQTVNNSPTYGHLMISGSGTKTLQGATIVNGNLNIAAATLDVSASNFALSVGGNWTNNGTFTPRSGTVTFNGSSAQTIGGTTATTFNNLTINNSIGLNVTGVTLTGNATVNGALALTSSDLDTGAFTLTQPNTTASTGVSDVVGTVKRTGGPFALATVLTFGNPNNQITFTAGATRPTDVTVLMAKTAPATYAAAVQRNYTLSQTAGAGFTATVRLHYLDAELNGNTPEASLNLRRLTGTWKAQLPTTVDSTNNFVESNNAVLAANFSTQWTFSTLAPTAANSSINGRIADSNGNPVEGAVIRLSGTQNRKTITDSNGNYRFDEVETNGFYTVTPSRVNYNFAPSARGFSALGAHTEASFAATTDGGHQNPLDTTEYFVRQQYVDFLGREPEERGLNDWTNTINNCAPNDASCDRVHVSEAFFRSEEFQQRGYVVYRFYSAALGRKPDFAEFTPDMARVSGFLTNDQLEAAKTAFANDFVTRPAFAQYATLSNAQYVDALSATAGVTLSNRQALTDSLNAGTMTRAAALRQIAESGEVYAKYYNQAFVVMEYFGYLRRDPDILYLNWMDVLNQGGDSRRMVEGFVDATEYRNRFRQ